MPQGMSLSDLFQFCGLKSSKKKKPSGKEKQVHGEARAQSEPKVLSEPELPNQPEVNSETEVEICAAGENSSTELAVQSNTEETREFKQFDSVEDYSDHYYAKKSPGKTNNEWAKKIQAEWKLLEKDLPASIVVRVYEDRIDLLRAAIVGPAGTPYHDGLYFFDIRFPSDYPHSPPKVNYRSGGLRINPNLYESGKVCLSLLNTWWGKGCERWSSSKSTILQVLISLEGLVLNEKPYFNEPSEAGLARTQRGEQNSLAYNDKLFLLCCKTMLWLIKNPPKHFESFVSSHFAERGSTILAACSAYSKDVPVGSFNKAGAAPRVPSAELRSGLEKLTPLLTAEFDRLARAAAAAPSIDKGSTSSPSEKTS